MMFQAYLIASPNAIVEAVQNVIPNGTTGSFVFSSGNVVGVRAAFSTDGITPASPWSAQLQVTFP